MTQVSVQESKNNSGNIANTLRGKMGADEFRDYILGLIFYKYLSEKIKIMPTKFYHLIKLNLQN